MTTFEKDIELFTNIFNFPFEYEDDFTKPLDDFSDIDTFPPDFEFDAVFKSENLTQLRIKIFSIDFEIQSLFEELFSIKEKFETTKNILKTRKRKRDSFESHMLNELFEYDNKAKKILCQINILKDRQSVLTKTLEILLSQVFWPDKKKLDVVKEKYNEKFFDNLAETTIQIKNKKSQMFKILDKTFEVLLEESKRIV